MKEGVIFVAVDVDDKAFHSYAIHESSEECWEFKTKPCVGQLVKKLKGLSRKGTEIKICYEATYIGYSLQRDLAKHGYTCEVVAPSLIPKKAGKRVKTDRVDSKELAKYYLKGELTMVHVPTENEEQIRDLIRGRNFLQKQRNRLKQYILSQCRRAGIHYKQEHGARKSHWTQTHEKWLEVKINKSGTELQYTLKALLLQLESLNEQITGYDREIERIGQTEVYQERVKALICYRGIGILTAMTIITELGDIRRFKHPRCLTSYAGLDLREYSSGGKEKRYGVTKMGNSHVRRSTVEACQLAFKPPCISRRLKASRAGVDVKYVAIADRCMKRLYKKSHRLLHAGKNRNVVKVACSRELLGFVWESLNEAA